MLIDEEWRTKLQLFTFLQKVRGLEFKCCESILGSFSHAFTMARGSSTHWILSNLSVTFSNEDLQPDDAIQSLQFAFRNFKLKTLTLRNLNLSLCVELLVASLKYLKKSLLHYDISFSISSSSSDLLLRNQYLCFFEILNTCRNLESLTFITQEEIHSQHISILEDLTKLEIVSPKLRSLTFTHPNNADPLIEWLSLNVSHLQSLEHLKLTNPLYRCQTSSLLNLLKDLSSLQTVMLNYIMSEDLHRDLMGFFLSD